ncbi:MAG: hypothetical protein A3K10_00765 [Bacteroidetes bacterium RIFCSPLOWO2_12_FULL_31_6]|nr:MAG: hypothetical protein A3K10_00765 [Bacteroidetes bacterium RIFCSPLOWO2_12_FULL_31_6]
MKIHYFTYQQIDKEKWDNCVLNSCNHLVYVESWYLDIVTQKNWSALILNDYEAVMPLPLKSKFHLTYVQQPIWTQQLGVFFKTPNQNDLVANFIHEIPKKLRLVSINLNEYNFSEKIKLKLKTNLTLNLNTSFDKIQVLFSDNTKRNIKKAFQNNLTIDFGSKDVENFIQYFKQNVPKPISRFHYIALSKIISHSISSDKGFIVLVKYKNIVVAAAFILRSEHRLIYRIGISNKTGKDLKAMFFLIEKLIKKYVNSTILFDFEGSELVGVSRFYKSFGASNTPYFYYKQYNSKLLQLIKKRK